MTWATSVPILVNLGLSVLDLGPMYATDRRQTWHDPACLAGSCHIIRQTRIIAYASTLWVQEHINGVFKKHKHSVLIRLACIVNNNY